MVPLTEGLGLLESAVRYALASAGPATPEHLPLDTPCAGWDLRMLLRHVGDSFDVVSEAMRTGCVGFGPAPGAGGSEPDPVSGLRHRATGLLAACAAARPPARLVVIADRELTTSIVAVAGAIEIAVHGWDISVACGVQRPIPASLAAALLPITPLLITPSTRPGLFGDPVPAPPGASPGDRLTAFLGRPPRLPEPPGTP